MSQRTIWATACVLLAAMIAGIYWWMLPASKPIAPQAAAPAPPESAESAAPVASPAASAIRYPIDTSQSPVDAAASAAAPSTIAALLVAALGRKAVLEFVNVDGFAQRVAATVDNLDRAHAPARLWPVHPTPGRLITLTSGDTLQIGAQNARRYAPFVDWVESLDVQQVGALYRRLYPQFQRAYEDLGYPGRYFNDRVVDVIDHLLSTPSADQPLAVRLPVVNGPIQPTRPWVMIEFADPALEARSAGQKLLLRVGSDNARRIQAKLAALRAVLTQPR